MVWLFWMAFLFFNQTMQETFKDEFVVPQDFPAKCLPECLDFWNQSQSRSDCFGLADNTIGGLRVRESSEASSDSVVVISPINGCNYRGQFALLEYSEYHVNTGFGSWWVLCHQIIINMKMKNSTLLNIVLMSLVIRAFANTPETLWISWLIQTNT